MFFLTTLPPCLSLAQSLPVAATNVMATPGDTALTATTANISFTIPNIAYTPETYSVKYTGMTLQTTQATSVIRMNSSNIATINQEFTIMLTGLEEDNTYTYTVDSTNCLGTTSTVEMSFRTLTTCKNVPSSFVSFRLFSLSSVFLFLIVLFIILLPVYFLYFSSFDLSLSVVPVGLPMECANTTYLPRNVTLVWGPPPLRDRNGAGVGYYLLCMNANGESVNGLIDTRNSRNTMFTITDVMPFTGYTCLLAFINVVGEGPTTQCTFETAQDSKYTLNWY